MPTAKRRNWEKATTRITTTTTKQNQEAELAVAVTAAADGKR